MSVQTNTNKGLYHSNPLNILAQHGGRGIALCIAIFCCVAGCGQPKDMLPVHGQVLFRGKPLEYGSVMFQPNEKGELARGKIQADGTFKLTTTDPGDGVHIGTCSVRVTAYEAQRPGGGEPAGKEEPTLGRSAIPTKYQSFGTSELTVEVGPDMELPVVLDLE